MSGTGHSRAAPSAGMCAQVAGPGGWFAQTTAGPAQGGLGGHSWRETTGWHLALCASKALFPRHGLVSQQRR